MATTNQRAAMVQIPLPTWAIFCTALDSGAVPDAQMLPFTRSLLGDYWPTLQTNGMAGNAAQANQQEGAGRRNRQASTAVSAKSKETIAPRARSARSGSRREQLTDLIRTNTAGMTRGEILDHFGLKGDKSGEMSISNALTALTKGNQLRRDGGRYLYVATQETRQPVAA